jgi:hypothetical protein
MEISILGSENTFFLNAFIYRISRYDQHNEVFYMRDSPPAADPNKR